MLIQGFAVVPKAEFLDKWDSTLSMLCDINPTMLAHLNATKPCPREPNYSATFGENVLFSERFGLRTNLQMATAPATYPLWAPESSLSSELN
jgi:hypothetical protein